MSSGPYIQQYENGSYPSQSSASTYGCWVVVALLNITIYNFCIFCNIVSEFVYIQWYIYLAFVFFPVFYIRQNTRYLLNIMYIFDRCRCSWAAVAPAEDMSLKQYDRLLSKTFKARIAWSNNRITWWRHQIESFAAFLAICAGNSSVTGEFPTHRPVTRSFGVFFLLAPEWTVKETIVRLVIWDAIAPIMMWLWLC